MNKKIRIITVDDDRIFRTGLRHQLSQDDRIELVSESDNGDAGLSSIRQEKPDIALVDFHMDGLDGIELIKAIKEQKIKLITLSREDDPFLLLQMIEAGSDAIIQKKGENLVMPAILSVMNDRGLLEPESGLLIVKSLLERQVLFQLNHNELVFFHKIGSGKDYETIASEMGIQESSAKNLLTKVKKKLKLKTKQDILHLYQRFFPT